MGVLRMAHTPSPEPDYSLFLSENGHLSFENPNYQENRLEQMKDIPELWIAFSHQLFKGIFFFFF